MTPRIAFLEREDGSVVLGRGPFESFRDPPGGAGPAFFSNDFSLGGETPWHLPKAGVETFPSIAEFYSALERDEGVLIAPDVVFDPPPEGEFTRYFESAKARIHSGEVEKVVPAVAAVGRLSQTPSGFLLPVPERITGSRLRLFGWLGDDGGFVGATPETLFRRQGNGLETVALAGTARQGEESALSNDTKQAHEHRVVVNDLECQLAPFGEVVCGERRTVELGTLSHLETRLRVALRNGVTDEDLIAALHPTPATGVAPRGEGAVAFLSTLRPPGQALGRFGAPFGLVDGDSCDILVGIRCLFRDGTAIAIPAGCGVVAESELSSEWAEIQLKIEAVRYCFGL